MKFTYFPLPDREKSTRDPRFLPSLALTVFSRMGADLENHKMQGMACRRVPHVIKQKLDILGRFKTSMSVPLTDEAKDYQEMTSRQYWMETAFLPPGEDHDYVLGGELSLDQGRMGLSVYSTLDDKVIIEKSYQGVMNDFPGFINDFIEEFLVMMELPAGRDELAGMRRRPAAGPESFFPLLEALDADLSRSLFPERQVCFLECLKKSLQADPKSDDVANLLVLDALSAIRRHETENAGTIADFILSLRPGDVQANFLKTRLLFHEDRTDEALARLDELVRQGHSIQKVPYLLGLELMETHFTEPAEIFFQKAAELEYSDPALYDHYGFLLISVGKLEKALEVLEQGLQKYPGRESILIYTAQLLAEMGRKEGATARYHEALHLYPDSPRLHASHAIFHVLNGYPDLAVDSMDEALLIAPEGPEINLEAARMFDYMGDADSAQRFARTAMELDPGSRLAGDAQDLLSRVAGGISAEEQGRNREKYIKAKRLFDAGWAGKSVKVLDEVTGKEPLFWKAWFLKGMAYRRLEKFEEALMAFGQVDDLFPDQASLHHEIGRCLMGMEKFKEAFPYLLHAFQLRPQDPVIMANMGLIYLFTGKFAEAEILLLQAQRMTSPGALDLDPYIQEARRLKKKKQSGRGNGESQDGKYKDTTT